MASTNNVLANPGFEAGDFSGWTIGGNSANSGVDVDGQLIAGTHPDFGQSFTNIHAGTFAGFALVAGTSQVQLITPKNELAIGRRAGTLPLLRKFFL